MLPNRNDPPRIRLVPPPIDTTHHTILMITHEIRLSPPTIATTNRITRLLMGMHAMGTHPYLLTDTHKAHLPLRQITIRRTAHNTRIRITTDHANPLNNPLRPPRPHLSDLAIQL
jgi:hypothetical protein